VGKQQVFDAKIAARNRGLAARTNVKKYLFAFSRSGGRISVAA